MKKLIILLLLNSMAIAEKNAITVYSTAAPGTLNAEQFTHYGSHIPGYAVVKTNRPIPIKKGQFQYAFTDVAALIDPTTVTFSVVENPLSASVLEQNFQFDLVGSEKLMEKYIDKNITVNYNNGNETANLSGTLLNASSDLVLKTKDNQIISLKSWNHIVYPSLPGGLLTKPTLMWLLNGTENATREARVSYQTQGLTWWADYNLVLSELNNTCTLDLSAWVTLINQSGASYHNTSLKLIAGDVNRASAPNNQHTYRTTAMLSVSEEDNGFQEKSFFEYHMYTLGKKVNLKDRSTKQLELMPTSQSIPCNKKLIFNASGTPSISYHRPRTEQNYMATTSAKIATYLEFKNSQDDGLGVPLPAGRVRVNQIDTDDDSLEFIGEDIIDHTAKNELISIKMGNAFDVIGERKQADIKLLPNGLKETFEIHIRNQKNKPQKVIIQETLYRWSNWSITSHSLPYEKSSANTIEFIAEVEPESEKIVTYTVSYHWPTEKK